MQKVILIFIDGLGLGPAVPTNPLSFVPTPGLSRLLPGKRLTMEALGSCRDGLSLKALDACLGVAGLPQSASGQAALFTGENGPRLLGRHQNGFPGATLKALVREKGLFTQLYRTGLRGTFANAYRPGIFAEVRRGMPGHYSCSTWLSYYGGVGFRSLVDLESGRAVHQDISNGLLVALGYPVTAVTPDTAARRLLSISRNYDFTLFEYFLSDVVAHRGGEADQRKVITVLDRFIYTLAERLQPDTLLLVTSDHGNLEDSTTRDHTFNPVPALAVGRGAEAVLRGMTDITHVFPCLLQFLLSGRKNVSD